MAMPSPILAQLQEDQRLRRLERYLEQLARSGFFGETVIKWQNGHPLEVRENRTHKMDEIGG